MSDNTITGELLRPLIDGQDQTACSGPCGRPLLPSDLNCVIDVVHDDTESVTGFSARLVCDICLRPKIPGQRKRHLHAV